MDEAKLDRMLELGQGNPGALTVLAGTVNLLSHEKILTALEELKFKGPKIWFAYKYVCGQDIYLFADKVLDKDENMIRLVRQECE